MAGSTQQLGVVEHHLDAAEKSGVLEEIVDPQRPQNRSKPLPVVLDLDQRGRPLGGGETHGFGDDHLVVVVEPAFIEEEGIDVEGPRWQWAADGTRNLRQIIGLAGDGIGAVALGGGGKDTAAIQGVEGHGDVEGFVGINAGEIHIDDELVSGIEIEREILDHPTGAGPR